MNEIQHHCQGDVDEFLSSLVEVPEVLELDRATHQRAARRRRASPGLVGGLTIRLATEADIPPMVELGRRFLKTSHYAKHLAESPEQMAKLGEFLLGGPGGMLCAERRGKIVGMLGYAIHDHFISGEKTATEVFWWVEPEHRGDGLRLLTRLETIMRARSVKKLQMIAPDERVSALYERLGYTFMESTFQKKLASDPIRASEPVPIQQCDAFAADALEVRNAVIAGGFTSEQGPDGALYTGISGYPVPQWYDRIAQLVGSPITPKLSCFRLNLAGEKPHSWIHSDDICAEYASVLYLNLPEQCAGGTAFWAHPEWGDHLLSKEELEARGIDYVAYHEMMTKEWRTLEPWCTKDFVPMRFNRFITYPTKFFHSRFPFDAFGNDGNDGRLIWICFYDKGQK